RNLTVYLGRTSNYEDSRFYSIKSAIELFGSCSEEVEAVTDAWHAVGVGDRYDDRGVVSDFYTLDTVSCSVPYTVNFINKSANGKSFMWDFGNGITSTSQNPSVTYTTFGDFDVSLVINGDSCGVDTLHKTDYISISNSNMCSYILQAGSNPLIDECEGRIFDDGGANNIYSN